MRKFTLVLFPDETRAFQGFHALENLQRKGSISVHAAALVERDEHGALSLRKRSHEVLLGTGLGGLVDRAPKDLLEFVARELAPGTFALVAEVREEWISPIDGHMEPLGGRVVCEWWTGSGDEFEQHAALAAAGAAPYASVRGRWPRS
jgi:hypothetical protein